MGKYISTDSVGEYWRIPISSLVPDSIWKLGICDKKGGNPSLMKQLDIGIDLRVHYRLPNKWESTVLWLHPLCQPLQTHTRNTYKIKRPTKQLAFQYINCLTTTLVGWLNFLYICLMPHLPCIIGIIFASTILKWNMYSSLSSYTLSHMYIQVVLACKRDSLAIRIVGWDTCMISSHLKGKQH